MEGGLWFHTVLLKVSLNIRVASYLRYKQKAQSGGGGDKYTHRYKNVGCRQKLPQAQEIRHHYRQYAHHDHVVHAHNDVMWIVEGGDFHFTRFPREEDAEEEQNPLVGVHGAQPYGDIVGLAHL